MTTTLKAPRAAPRTADDILDRYPLLVSHLICESLGYFSPRAAAHALLAHLQDLPHSCEWYMSMAAAPPPNHRTLQQVNQDAIARAFAARHRHQDLMRSYPQARLLVEAERRGARPVLLQSW